MHEKRIIYYTWEHRVPFEWLLQDAGIHEIWSHWSHRLAKSQARGTPQLQVLWKYLLSFPWLHTQEDTQNWCLHRVMESQVKHNWRTNISKFCILKINQDAHRVHIGDPNLQALRMQCPIMHSYVRKWSSKFSESTYSFITLFSTHFFFFQVEIHVGLTSLDWDPKWEIGSTYFTWYPWISSDKKMSKKSAINGSTSLGNNRQIIQPF